MLKIKIAQSNEHKIKASFTDDTIQEEVKELIYTYVDDQPKELHLQLELQLIKLGDQYDLFEYRDWKLLSQIGGQALEGCIEEIWAKNVETTQNHGSRTDTATRRKRFYFGEDAIDDQKDVRRMVS
jgi:hypothetical protein